MDKLIRRSSQENKSISFDFIILGFKLSGVILAISIDFQKSKRKTEIISISFQRREDDAIYGFRKLALLLRLEKAFGNQ